MSALYREIADALRPVIREELLAALDAQKAPPSPYMTTAEVAARDKVTEDTVRRWVREGRIECIRRNGKILIPRETGR